MKITCTVSEFANLVCGCQHACMNSACHKCALYTICSERDGSIEQFVSADRIVDEQEENDG